MVPTPTKPAAMPVVDGTMHEPTTTGNEAEEEVSQGTQEVEKWSRCRIEEGGSQVKHGMAKANHMTRVHGADKSEDEGEVNKLEVLKYNPIEREHRP